MERRQLQRHIADLGDKLERTADACAFWQAEAQRAREELVGCFQNTETMEDYCQA